jgi:hypothetical protein
MWTYGVPELWLIFYTILLPAEPIFRNLISQNDLSSLHRSYDVIRTTPVWHRPLMLLTFTEEVLSYWRSTGDSEVLVLRTWRGRDRGKPRLFPKCFTEAKSWSETLRGSKALKRNTSLGVPEFDSCLCIFYTVLLPVESIFRNLPGSEMLQLKRNIPLSLHEVEGTQYPLHANLS